MSEHIPPGTKPTLSSKTLSVFRTGKLFAEGWYSDEREWVDADTYRNLMRALEAKQAKIDALMLEFCPGEMSAEQKAEWARHQRPVHETNVGAYDPTLGPPPRPKVPSAERWPKTPADLFDQYPVGTIFQKKSDGRVLALTPDDGVTHEARAPLKANACQCDPNPSIGGSPPCPVHDREREG